MFVKNESKRFSAKWNIEHSFSLKKRFHRVKKSFDELQVDESIGRLFQSRGIL